MKYVITGAAGKVAGPLITSLLNAGRQVTVIGRNPANLERFRSMGARIEIGSLEDQEFLVKAFAGANAAFTMCPPNFTTDDLIGYHRRIADNLVKAIQQNGLTHVVNLSSLAAWMKTGAGPASGLYWVEQELDQLDGVNILHLRTAYFYDNLFSGIELLKQYGVLGSNFSAESGFAFSSPSDIAEAGVEALLQLNFTGHSHRYIVSDEVGTKDLASSIGKAIGMNDLSWSYIPSPQLFEGMVQSGVSKDMAAGLVQLGETLHSGEAFREYRREKSKVFGKVKAKDFAQQFAGTFHRKQPAIPTELEVIIIGAGPAGLAASYLLRRAGIEHHVFEKGRIGEVWRSQRWNGFVMNTSNKLNALPGQEEGKGKPDGFSTAIDFVAGLEEYVRKFELPVNSNCEVVSVEKNVDTSFTVTVMMEGKARIFSASQVIVCAGGQNQPSIPRLSSQINGHIRQLHVSEYRDAATLPKGAVLVVGSAQSGCQVAKDLAEQGRKVFLSTSQVARVPRTYRGRDIMDWLIDMQFFEAKTSSIDDAGQMKMRAPQLAGDIKEPRTLSLQSLGRRGVTLLGKCVNANGNELHFEGNAEAHVRFADGFSRNVKAMIDGFIAKTGADAEMISIDREDEPDSDLGYVRPGGIVDLTENNIGSIIWATGFHSRLDFLHLPALTKEGDPVHEEGRSVVEGLYFLGFHWLRTRKSGLLCGIREDAESVIDEVVARVKRAG